VDVQGLLASQYGFIHTGTSSPAPRARARENDVDDGIWPIHQTLGQDMAPAKVRLKRAPQLLGDGAPPDTGMFDHPVAFGQAAPPAGVAQLQQWWNRKSAELRGTVDAWTDPKEWHLWMNRRIAGGVWGIDIPTEAVDPAAARDYLADMLEQLGQVHRWPAGDVARRAAGMRAVAPSGTVAGTVDQVARFGPPRNWPGGAAWYELASSIKESAAAVSLGERWNLWSAQLRGSKEMAREALELAQEAMPMLERFATGAALVGPATGLGLGIGMGAAVGLVGAVVLGAAFYPELQQAGAAVGVWRATRKTTAKKKKTKKRKAA
jgi:hypothetical protein